MRTDGDAHVRSRGRSAAINRSGRFISRRAATAATRFRVDVLGKVTEGILYCLKPVETIIRRSFAILISSISSRIAKSPEYSNQWLAWSVTCETFKLLNFEFKCFRRKRKRGTRIGKVCEWKTSSGGKKAGEADCAEEENLGAIRIASAALD